MAHRAVRQQQPVFRIVAAHGVDGALEILPRADDVVRMHRAFPMHVAARSAVLGLAEQLVGAVVPIEFVGVQIELPDADLGGVQRQREPTRQPLQLHLAAAQFVDVLQPLVDQAAGHDGRDQDQRAAGQDQQPQQPGIAGASIPAALWHGGDPPRAGRQHDVGDDGIVSAAVCASPKKRSPAPPLPSRPEMRDVDGQVVRRAVRCRDRAGPRRPPPRRCPRSSCSPWPSSTKTGKRPMKPLPPCTRSTGPASTSSPAVAGAQRRLALRVVLAVVQPDRRLVALERVTSVTTRSGAPAMFRSCDRVRRAGSTASSEKRLWVISGSVDSVATKPAHKLDVAVDVAFELGA